MFKNSERPGFDNKLGEFRNIYPDPTKETTGLGSSYQEFLIPLSERKC